MNITEAHDLLAEGKTPSSAQRAIEEFDRALKVQNFLEEQFQHRLTGEDSCSETFAGILELIGGCLNELRQQGLLRRDVDVAVVDAWLCRKARDLRSCQKREVN